MQVGASAAKSSILTNCARGCLCTLTMARGRRQEAGGNSWWLRQTSESDDAARRIERVSQPRAHI